MSSSCGQPHPGENVKDGSVSQSGDGSPQGPQVGLKGREPLSPIVKGPGGGLHPGVVGPGALQPGVEGRRALYMHAA